MNMEQLGWGQIGIQQEDNHNHSESELDDVRSQYPSSDEYDSPVMESDNEKLQRMAPNFPLFNPTLDPFKFEPTLGLKFRDPSQLKDALRYYAVEKKQAIKFKRSRSKYLLAECKPGCTWRLYASWMRSESSFQIKSLMESHKCSKSYNMAIANSRWIAKVFHNKIINNPRLKWEELKDEVKDRYRLDVTLKQCGKAKKFALGEVDEIMREHYAKLWDYAAELKQSIPGSSCNIQVDRPTLEDSGIFQRFYGELLTAIGRDGNNWMFPIAWAVVESETKDAWMWFLDQLSAYLNLCDGRGYTMISDQQKGLENAIKEVLPNIEHRMCARHVYANFRALFTGGTLKNLFWQAAKCGTEREFDDIMIKIREISPEAEEYLTVKKTPSQWCRAWYGTHSGCDSVENNMCETFNGVIVEARTLKIIDMLEDIRRYITRRMQIKAKEIDRWEGTVCPRIVKKMEKTEENCGHWKAEFCGNNLWEVKSTRHGYKVDLNNSMCSCRQWDISGVPCVHALAAILECKGEKEEYVAGWFKVDKIKKAYSKFLGPLNGENLWAKTGYLPIIPPKDRRMPGRPKIARRKQRHESPSKGQGAKVTKNQCAQPKRVSRVGGKNQCSLCKEYGHNKAKCPQKGQIVINVNTLEQSQSQSININAPQNSSTNDPQCSNIGQSSITEPPSHDNFLLSTLLPTKAATPRGTSTKTAAPKGTSTKTAAPRRTSTKAATPRGTSTKTAAPKGTSTKTAAPRGTSTKTAAQRGTFIKFAAPRGTSTKNAAPRMISTNNSGHAMPSTMTAALRLSSTNNSGHAFEATMTAAPIMSSTKNSGHSMPSTMTAAPRMSSTNNSSQQMPSTMTAGQPRPPLAMILNKTFKPPISKITSRSPISKSISELDPMLQKREPLPQKSFNPPFNFGMYQCPNGGMYSRAPGAKRGRWTPGPKNQPTTKSHQVQPPPSTSQASNTVVKRCLDTSTKKWKSLNDL